MPKRPLPLILLAYTALRDRIMLAGMKHKATLSLGFVLLALVAARGGTPQPTPAPTSDMDTTVEARVEVAKASLVAPTAAPLPTYPPAPAAAPEVVVKELPAEKIVEVVVEEEVPIEKIVEVSAWSTTVRSAS